MDKYKHVSKLPKLFLFFSFFFWSQTKIITSRFNKLITATRPMRIHTGVGAVQAEASHLRAWAGAGGWAATSRFRGGGGRLCLTPVPLGVPLESDRNWG